MINLIGRAATKVFLSPQFSHPAQSGANAASYTITHNFGKRPDYVQVYEVGTHRTWVFKRDYWQNNFPGFVLFSRGFTWSSVNANQISVTIWNLDGAREVYVKAFLTGEEVQAL